MGKRLVRWLLERETVKKRLLQLAIDALIILSCFILAMMLRLDRASLLNFLSQTSTWYVMFPVIPITILTFIRFGLYRAIIRFIATRAIRVVLILSLFSGLVMFVANIALGFPIPRSVPIIYSIILFCAIVGSRFAARAAVDLTIKSPVENAVIYGAGDAGRQLLTALNADRHFRVVAFIDDDVKLHGREIDMITIHPPSAMEGLKRSLDVNIVMLATPSARASDRKRIISMLEEHALQVRSIPSIGEIVSGNSRVSDLSNVQIEDLLARESVEPHPDLIAKTVKNKNVMVTGAGGSIGSELCRQILELGPARLLLYDISEHAVYQINQELAEAKERVNASVVVMPFVGSIRNQRLLAYIFNTFDVDTVFHAAAYKHVPLVEQNVIEGCLNNVFGTKTVMETAIAAGVENFTLISTDKAVRPTNFMGASKRLAELICQADAASQISTNIAIVRFGNVMWSSGSVLPRFEEQIMRGGPITVTHPEITRYFMTIPEAAQLVLQASAMSSTGGEVFVLDMGEPVKILDVAKSMIRLHGMLPQLNPKEDMSPGEIAIKFSGLRPGEKLYEELLLGDAVKATDHPRILSAQESMLDWEELSPLLSELEAACESMDVAAVQAVFLRAPLNFCPRQETSDLLFKVSQSAAAGQADRILNVGALKQGASTK